MTNEKTSKIRKKKLSKGWIPVPWAEANIPPCWWELLSGDRKAEEEQSHAGQDNVQALHNIKLSNLHQTTGSCPGLGQG